jgi:hypothetical protein
MLRATPQGSPSRVIADFSNRTSSSCRIIITNINQGTYLKYALQNILLLLLATLRNFNQKI